MVALVISTKPHPRGPFVARVVEALPVTRSVSPILMLKLTECRSGGVENPTNPPQDRDGDCATAIENHQASADVSGKNAGAIPKGLP